MPITLSSGERGVAAAVCAMLAIALFAPAVAQHADYHAFADQRILFGVPHALDVWSNLPFLAVGLFGGYLLTRNPGLEVHQRLLGTLCCVGLVLTGIGSTWYHLDPNDAGLAVDRLSMSIAFAGVLGLAALEMSERMGYCLAAAVGIGAPLAVFVWVRTGNLLPWVVVQAGGMLLLLLVAFASTRGTRDVRATRWGVVVALYSISKLFELADHPVWELTGQRISGHSMKHVVAALALLPIVLTWRKAAGRRQKVAVQVTG